MMPKSSILVLGVGNPFRADDGLGWVAVDALQLAPHWCVSLQKIQDDGTTLMMSWEGYERVMVVDAIYLPSAPAGSIYYLDAHHDYPLPTVFRQTSSHGVGVTEAIELAQTLQQLPSELIIYGIVGQDFSMKQGLSNEVQNALPELLNFIHAHLGAWTDQAVIIDSDGEVPDVFG